MSAFAAEIPKVHPFNFPKTISEGQSVVATCTVAEGSKPIQLQWLKNGQEVHDSATVNVGRHETYTALIIKKVSVEDAGNYTCVAKNAFGYDRYTSLLVVNAPPKWLAEPFDVTLTSDQQAVIHCAVFGHPVPVTTWSRSGADLKTSGSSRIVVAGNGTLTITNSARGDAGHYTCTSSNGVGSPLSKTISLAVKSKAASFQNRISSRLFAHRNTILTDRIQSRLQNNKAHFRDTRLKIIPRQDLTRFRVVIWQTRTNFRFRAFSISLSPHNVAPRYRLVTTLDMPRDGRKKANPMVLE